MAVSNKYAKQKGLILISCFLMSFTLTDSFAAINAFDRAVDHPPIPILDEQGNHVLETHKPYSPKKTCAGSGCHDYEGITHAYHFEMGSDEASDNYGEKRGLPSLVSPGYYGGYTCMQGNNPQVLAKKVNPGAPCYLTKFRDSCRLNSFTYAANGRCPERPASVTTTHKSRFVITPSNGWTAIRNAILASLARYRALRLSELPCRLSGTKNHHFAIAPFP